MLKGYRTVIFHSLYGLPAAALAVLDVTREVDITPILARFMSIDDVPFVLAIIAAGAFYLRVISPGFGGHNDEEPQEREAPPA